MYKTPLVRINGRLTLDTHIRDIPQAHVILVPVTELALMQDNAPPHSARATMAYLQDHNVNVMPWPGRSKLNRKRYEARAEAETTGP